MLCLNPYFIGLPILIRPGTDTMCPSAFVSILILLDYLFLLCYNKEVPGCTSKSLNPYFIGLPILIITYGSSTKLTQCLNPYFIGLPILIVGMTTGWILGGAASQSLFYWITYSYSCNNRENA